MLTFARDRASGREAIPAPAAAHAFHAARGDPQGLPRHPAARVSVQLDSKHSEVPLDSTRNLATRAKARTL
jgi:hypothetical protein